MIEAKSLHKRFGDLVAVDALSFQVGDGEVLGFLGPNGAGKSTTMKMLTGFLAPTSGSARIEGHDIVSDTLAAQRVMGYLPEGAPLYGELNVEQTLEFVARARGVGDASAVDAAIARLQLEPVRLQPVETLSKGFKRRVGLAQAILHDPKVLILDEPTDGLDPNQKHQVRQLIRDMAADKIIVISTHILEEVAALCSRVMIIAEGRLLADETPQGLLARSRYHQAVSLVAPEPERLASRFSQLPEAAAVEVHRREIVIFPRPGARLFPAVGRMIEEEGIEVSRMRLEEGRLDEVFREITTRGGEARPGAADLGNPARETTS